MDPEPSKTDNDAASLTVFSNVLYTSLPTTFFALASADCKSGWTWATSGSGTAMLDLRLCLGGEEKAVVTVVAAVRGLSAAADDMAACEDGGNFPVNSRLRIRDLRPSSSSQTVDGALVDKVDSLPS